MRIGECRSEHGEFLHGMLHSNPLRDGQLLAFVLRFGVVDDLPHEAMITRLI
jgi:hypothetical protein